MKYFKFLLFIPALAILGSCVSFDSSESSSWAGGDSKNVKGTIRIVSVSAEKRGEWGVLENEISALLPLLFFEEACLVVSPSDPADYSAEVTVREREYTDGWQTRRSLSAEARLWADDGSSGLGLPVSAGRALNQGKQSFASSKTLSTMLRKAVKNAVRGLPGKPGKPGKPHSIGPGVN